jgi:cytosine/adenosine deaminase-related metal-dependent hydrolase
VHACLAAAVTTIADCSYADTVAEAAIAQGLRAIVYLEAFSDQGDPAGLMAGRLDALPSHPLITPGISPHAPYTVTTEHYQAAGGAGTRTRHPGRRPTCSSRSATSSR